MEQKSTGTAYLLWFFVGALGAHKFYLGKTGTGVLYLLTLGLLGFGLLYDLFTIPAQVETANLKSAHRYPAQPQVIHVSQPAAAQAATPEQRILRLTTPDTYLSMRDIIRETGLSLEVADQTIDKLLERGLLRKQMNETGEVVFVER